MKDVLVPDIGDFKDVEVIEILVKPGDTIAKEQSLVSLESDKATMEIPSPEAGVVRELKVKVGDKVSEGSLLLKLEPGGAAKESEEEKPRSVASAPPAPAPAVATVVTHDAPVPPEPKDAVQTLPHASPSIRKFARELGVDLARVTGSGPKGRILREDVQAFVKGVLAGRPAQAAAAAKGGALPFNLPAWPDVDFAKFGPIESKPLSRIQKLSGPYLHRNWVSIPHVTQCDDADITDLEAFRQKVNEENAKSGVKVTPLAFLIKAVVAALKKFPAFNGSLDGENLVFKNYWNIGFAADTPQGLVVPVIKGADRKGVIEIAKETSELAAKAREGKLGPAEMQGGTFSISSLCGIGGTAFTPIINAPEVAILGVSKAATKPVWNGREFAPRQMMPLSLSYDHRVIDGASAARFTTYLAQVIADMRRSLL